MMVLLMVLNHFKLLKQQMANLTNADDLEKAGFNSLDLAAGMIGVARNGKARQTLKRWNHRHQEANVRARELKVNADEINTARGMMLVFIRAFPDDLDEDVEPTFSQLSVPAAKLYIEHNKQDVKLLKSCDTCIDAVGYGNLALVELLHNGYQINYAQSETALKEACYQGNLEMAKYLNSIGCEATLEILSIAMRRNHLHIIKYFKEQGHCAEESWSSSLMDEAALYGCLEVVKYLHQKRNEGCTVIAMNLAAENGHYEVVKFLHENRSEGCTTKAMDGAIKAGSLRIYKFLHANRKEGCRKHALANAVWTPQTDGATVKMLEWVVNTYGGTFDLMTFYYEVVEKKEFEGRKVDSCCVGN
ncbi:hypothetical protein HDU76_012122 [Blyttiomyces sp. JEL0837]|nr:hypothetical protein HDU76_012122 [Blyttiomyces sp. JEL0837]